MDNLGSTSDVRSSIKVLTNIDQLRQIEDHWDKLAQKQGHYMPFLSFDWYSLWIEHFLGSNQLCILVLYKNGGLAAIAPLLKKTVHQRGVNVIKIELIGNAYSPFRYFLFDEEKYHSKVGDLTQLFQFFIQDHFSWNLIDFSGIPEENRLFDALEAAVTNFGLNYTYYISYGDWYLDDISTSGQQYFASLPKKIRKDVSYSRRRLQKIGNLRFEVITNATSLDHYMDLYYQVYSQSWQRTELIGPTFHRHLAKVASKHGWLRLAFLFLDDSPIATQFWLSCNDYSYILKTVYDQDYKKYSPGKILTSDMIQYVIDVDKVTSIDYVQGDEPYKKDWTPQRRERKGLYVFNSNLKGKYLYWITNYIQPIINRSKYLNKIKKYLKK